MTCMRKSPQTLMYLQVQSPGGGTVWKALGGWSCWSRCITKVGFQVLKPMTGQCLFFCLLPSKQDIKLPASAPAPCLSVFHHDDHAVTVTEAGPARHSPPRCHTGLPIREQRRLPVCQCSAPSPAFTVQHPSKNGGAHSGWLLPVQLMQSEQSLTHLLRCPFSR